MAKNEVACCEKFKTTIGGQALIEGIMMRGPEKDAIVIRGKDGLTVEVNARKLNPPKSFKNWPFFRGMFNFFDAQVTGVKALMRSADLAPEEYQEEPTKFETWLAEKLKIDVMSVITTLSLVLGVAMSVGLFVFLPYLLSSLVANATGLDDEGIWFNLLEGLVRVAIFVGYIVLTSLMKDIRRTYMYHGAEHKTITCFELGKPLTVENVKGCSRVHDRCGTTFLFLVMVIAIVVFSISNSLLAPILNIQNSTVEFLVRFVFKLLLLPLVAGISYEILKLLANIQSPWIFPLKAPGLALQRLTTREPDDDMIECAIAAFERVLKMDADSTVPESSFAVGGTLSDVKKHVDKLFERAKIEGDDCQWILSLSLGIPLSDLEQERLVTAPEARKIYKMVNERLTGRPLWYIVGDTSFCGYTVKLDERVLIPRPETEILVENAVKGIRTGDKVLDLCTGSGAIAVAVGKMCENKNIAVTASDISEDALALAEQNAAENGVNVSFIHSDLFEKIEGTFDVILSNPPYIASQEIDGLQREVKDFEPRLALDGGADGLDFYRRIASAFKSHLNPEGFMLLELGMGQANEVQKLFEAEGATTQILKDLANIDRILKVTL